MPSRLPKDLRSFITPFLRSHSPLPICPQMNATWIDIGFYWILIDKLLHQHHETSFPIQNQFESQKSNSSQIAGKPKPQEWRVEVDLDLRALQPDGFSDSCDAGHSEVQGAASGFHDEPCHLSDAWAASWVAKGGELVASWMCWRHSPYVTQPVACVYTYISLHITHTHIYIYNMYIHI